jgi:tetratricopeptide (TPR) repeat protein
MQVRLGLWLLACAALSPGVAFAQQSSEDMARAHFSSASAYYEQGRYEDAARAFMEAYRLSPRPELLDNAARAYERALLFDEAIETLRTMRSAHAEYRDEATINSRIESLERLKERVGSGGGGGEAPPPSGGAPPAPRSGGGISIPGIALLAVGGAIGLVSIITGGVAHGTYESLSSMCDPSGVCDPSLQGDIDTGNALAITSTVTFFTSIAAIGVGIVLLIVDSGGGGGHAGLDVVPGPGDVGLALETRF